MGYNIAASVEKSTFTNKKDFGNCQDIFGQFSWSKKDSNCLDAKHKVFKREMTRDFRLVQSLTMGKADFNQFMRLRIELVVGAETFAREENLSPVLIPTMSKDMDEQLKLAHKMVDVVNQTDKKICLTLLRYSVSTPERS